MLFFLIKEIRLIRNITLKQLKEQTGVSISYLSEIENNKVKNPILLVMVKIAKALDSKMDELYFFDSELDGLKRALDVYVKAYGINHEKTIKLSQIVKEKINEMEKTFGKNEKT